jgi:aryl-alcohol dehydrogenase-like predicted oxidoreductase
MERTHRMKAHRLGNPDMEITPLGFGSWATGTGNWEFAWGPQDDPENRSPRSTARSTVA